MASKTWLKVWKIFFAFSKLLWMSIHVLQAQKILWIIPATTDRLYLSGAKAWKFIKRPVSVFKKPIGSQPPRLYGWAKIHKPTVPVRPVLLIPGSAYHKISLRVADWLSIVSIDIKLNELISPKIMSLTIYPFGGRGQKPFR